MIKNSSKGNTKISRVVSFFKYHFRNLYKFKKKKKKKKKKKLKFKI